MVSERSSAKLPKHRYAKLPKATVANQPSHVLFFIKKTAQVDDNGRNKNKGLWTRIGAGWEVTNGRVNIVQDFYPTGVGTLQLVPAAELSPQEN